MFDTPAQWFTPERAWDGEGMVESFTPGTGTTLWVDMVAHGAQLNVLVRSEEPVAVGDMLALPYRTYPITSAIGRVVLIPQQVQGLN